MAAYATSRLELANHASRCKGNGVDAAAIEFAAASSLFDALIDQPAERVVAVIGLPKRRRTGSHLRARLEAPFRSSPEAARSAGACCFFCRGARLGVGVRPSSRPERKRGPAWRGLAATPAMSGRGRARNTGLIAC